MPTLPVTSTLKSLTELAILNVTRGVITPAQAMEQTVESVESPVTVWPCEEEALAEAQKSLARFTNDVPVREIPVRANHHHGIYLSAEALCIAASLRLRLCIVYLSETKKNLSQNFVLCLHF